MSQAKCWVVPVPVPVASSPYPFAPLAQTVWSDLIARLWPALPSPSPVAMAVTPVRLLTCTGTEESVVVPLPSWPTLFLPHAQTVPWDLSARLSSSPAAIAVTPVRLFTFTAKVAFVVVPLPSWPLRLSPQAQTVPSDLSATLCPRPAAI